MENLYILFKVTFVTGLLLLIPGYSLFLALFPRDSRYDSIQKLGLSGILGLSLNIIIGTIQTQIKNGFGLNVFIHIGILSIISFCCLAVYLRRKGSIPNNPTSFQQQLPVLRNLISKYWIPVVAFGFIFVVGTVLFLNLYPQPTKNSFTEFYVLDPAKTIPFNLESNPTDNKIHLVIGIVNDENREVNYKIQLEQAGEAISEPVRISLAHGAKWQDEIAVDPLALNPNVESLNIVLYVDDLTAPYRKLRIVLPQNQN